MHQFLRKEFDSIVSLREITRFSRCLRFFIFEEGEEDKQKTLIINKTRNLFIYYLRL